MEREEGLLEAERRDGGHRKGFTWRSGDGVKRKCHSWEGLVEGWMERPWMFLEEQAHHLVQRKTFW